MKLSLINSFNRMQRMGLSVDEVAATLRRRSLALEVDESGKWVRGQTRLDDDDDDDDEGTGAGAEAAAKTAAKMAKTTAAAAAELQRRKEQLLRQM